MKTLKKNLRKHNILENIFDTKITFLADFEERFNELFPKLSVCNFNRDGSSTFLSLLQLHSGLGVV